MKGQTWREVKDELDRQNHATGWEGFVRRIQRKYYALQRAIDDAPRQVHWAYQRVVRGWDDRACWSLDAHLCKILGEQLVQMADIAHGYPGDGEYPVDDETSDSFDRWVADLRTNGMNLRAYHAADSMDAGWEDVHTTAQESLRWVAEHLSALWD